MNEQRIDALKRKLHHDLALEVNDPRRWWILAACSLVAFAQVAQPQLLIMGLDPPTTVFVTEWPSLRVLSSIGVVLFVTFQLMGGVFGDLLGRRRIFLLGTGGFLLGNVLTIFFPQVPGLLYTRSITGVMGAMVFPLTIGIIRLVFTGPERSRALLIYTFATGIGTLTSLLAILIQSWFGVRATLILPTIIGLLGIFLAWRYLPESRARGGFGRVEAIVAASWTLVFLALIFGLSMARSLGTLFNPITLAAGVFSALGTGIMITWTQRSMSPGGLRTSKRVSRQFLSLLLLISATLSFALTGYLLQLFNFFSIVQGHSALVSGIFLFPILLFPALALRLIERFSTEQQGYVSVTTGLIAMTVALFMTSFSDANIPYLFLIPMMGLFGIGFLLTTTVWSNIYLTVLPTDLVGASSGISKAAGLVGGALAGVVLTTISQVNGLSNFQSQLEAAGVTAEQQERALYVLSTLLWGGGIIEEGTPQAIIQLALLQAYRESYRVGVTSSMLTAAGLCLFTGALSWIWLRRWTRALQAPLTSKPASVGGQ